MLPFFCWSKLEAPLHDYCSFTKAHISGASPSRNKTAMCVRVAMSPGETGCLDASETQLDLPGILGRGGGVGIDVQASGH